MTRFLALPNKSLIIMADYLGILISDWDRCRRLCPIKKPEPPTAPGAQLVPYPIGDNNFVINLLYHKPYLIDNY